MISILRLKEYLAECKASIEAINSTMLVVDDSQIVDKMASRQDKDNQILVAVIPEFDSAPSTSEDAIQDNNFLAFLVLEKTNYSALNDDKEILIWERTQKTIELLRQKLLLDSDPDEGSGTCPEMQFLDVTSIKIQPVWKLAQCNGWILTAILKK